MKTKNNPILFLNLRSIRQQKPKNPKTNIFKKKIIRKTYVDI